MTAIAAITLLPLTFMLAAVGSAWWQDRPVNRVRAMRPSVTIRRWAPCGWFWDVEWPGGTGTAGFARTHMGARFAVWRVAR